MAIYESKMCFDVHEANRNEHATTRMNMPRGFLVHVELRKTPYTNVIIRTPAGAVQCGAALNGFQIVQSAHARVWQLIGLTIV